MIEVLAIFPFRNHVENIIVFDIIEDAIVQTAFLLF